MSWFGQAGGGPRPCGVSEDQSGRDQSLDFPRHQYELRPQAEQQLVDRAWRAIEQPVGHLPEQVTKLDFEATRFQHIG